MRAADQSGSVASDTQGTGTLRGDGLTGRRALVYLTFCAAVSFTTSLVGERAASEVVAAGGARPPAISATVQMPPAADEGGWRWGGDRNPQHSVERAGSSGRGVNTGTQSLSSVPVPIATDSNGTERVVPAALWSAIVEHFPHHEHAKALSVAHCESRYRTDVVGALGERGVFQVRPEYHGAVPTDVASQVKQAARIQSAHGWRLWACG